MIEINDSQFSDVVLKSELPVLVDCWAPWCTPCNRLAPVLKELSNEYSEKLKIVKINIDENPVVVSTYGIRSIPFLMFIKNGELLRTIPGALPKNKLMEVIDQTIGV